MELTKEALQSALDYFNSVEISYVDQVADLLYYKPADLEALGLTIDDVIDIFDTK